ncbi:MAG TPA: hypothetical protein VFS75_01610 [Candidatus Paceibacterota bacterium]|nr:hypothetical protein [Candidatus Paceibacterota bacterium]
MAENARENADERDRARGIENATSRFKREHEARLTSADLIRKAEARRGGTVPEGERARADDGAARPRASSRRREEEAALADELRALSDAGIAYDEGDERLLLDTPPDTPSFPGVILVVAAVKDILDGLDVTGIGVVVATALSFLMSLVLFLWTLSRQQGGWWKQKGSRSTWSRYAGATIVEFIPFLQMLPAESLYVVMTYVSESKLGRSLQSALERARMAKGKE